MRRMQKFQQEVINFEKEFGDPKRQGQEQSQDDDVVWSTQKWDTWHGVQNAPAHPDDEFREAYMEKAWEAAKAKRLKRRQAPASPAARRFNAPNTLDTEVARRVEAVAKLEDLRQSWDTGVVKSAATREEARNNMK